MTLACYIYILVSRFFDWNIVPVEDVRKPYPFVAGVAATDICTAAARRG